MTSHLGGPESPDMLAQRQARYAQPGSRQYRIMADGESIGHVGYWEREWHHETVWEAGWAVLPAFQGRGIASAAMRLLLEVIAAEPVGWAVHAFPSVRNAASNAVCRKTGFQLLGEFDFDYPPGHQMRCNDWALPSSA